jgi:plastocyanin
VGVIGFISYSFINQPKKPDVGTLVVCKTKGTHHSVVIQDDKVMPEHTQAKLCDTLTITNNDDAGRLMAFGVHEAHLSYDGVTEQMLHQGDGFTITLNRSGTYTFHDHIHDDVSGDFTVIK